VLRACASGAQHLVWLRAFARAEDDASVLFLYGVPGQPFDSTVYGRPVDATDAAAGVAPLPDAFFFHVGDDAPRPARHDADAFELVNFVNPALYLYAYDTSTHAAQRLLHEPCLPATGPPSADAPLTLNVLDVCCGTGGLSAGLGAAKLEDAPDAYLVPCVGVDIDYNAINNACLNLPGRSRFAVEVCGAPVPWQAHAQPLEDFAVRLVPACAAHRAGVPPAPVHISSAGRPSASGPLHRACLPGGCGLLAGGLPCQGFSGANPANLARGYDDKRNELFDTYGTCVACVVPRFTLVEEVPAFCGSHYATLLGRRLLRLRYQVLVAVLQAGDFGAPQSRVRAFVAGAEYGSALPEPPRPTHDFRPHGDSGPSTRSGKLHHWNERNLFSGIPGLAKALGSFARCCVAPKPAERARLAPRRTVRDAIGDLPAAAWRSAEAEHPAAPPGLRHHWCAPLGHADAARASELAPGARGASLRPELLPQPRRRRKRSSLGSTSAAATAAAAAAAAGKPAAGKLATRSTSQKRNYARLDWEGAFNTVGAAAGHVRWALAAPGHGPAGDGARGGGRADVRPRLHVPRCAPGCVRQGARRPWLRRPQRA
jgi:site-specific DNA-cytosine methylase